MTNLDLPHFVVTASSDTTRWQFDVNAHVSTVTNDSIVFSHEQRTGAKNGSMIIEDIILEHLLQCRGEAIKVIISDNASVGNNWLTTIAFPQYFVNQGFADVCLVLFLENNRGKYLPDMLFGQFQTKRRRQTLLGIDDMLSGFESLKRKNGKVRGFALNPLSSVDFQKVFTSLGYETSPPKDFGFVKRNIHFAAACARVAQKRLSLDVRRLIGSMLPDEPGMVRICSEPPSTKSQSELAYEDRYVDVPAVHLPVATSGQGTQNIIDSVSDQVRAPLVVPLDKQFSQSGTGVVSSRTADKVGHNGIGFRDSNACPELRVMSSSLVRRAWPLGLIRASSGQISEEPIAGIESTKCTPENWIMRKPVSHFCMHESDWKARYPPRNLLNAKFRKGPRELESWIPPATYYEPPFPLEEKTAAHSAMKGLSETYKDVGESLSVLQALREVFREAGNRDDASDPWLHRRATFPRREAIESYQNALQVHIARGDGHPKAPLTLKRAFREDSTILREVSQLEHAERVKHSNLSSAESKKIREKMLARLFAKGKGGREAWFDSSIWSQRTRNATPKI